MPCQRLFVNPVSTDSPQELQLVSETESPFAAEAQARPTYLSMCSVILLFVHHRVPILLEKNASVYCSQDFPWRSFCTLPQQFSGTVAIWKNGLCLCARSSAVPHLVTFRMCRWVPPTSADLLTTEFFQLVFPTYLPQTDSSYDLSVNKE